MKEREKKPKGETGPQTGYTKNDGTCNPQKGQVSKTPNGVLAVGYRLQTTQVMLRTVRHHMGCELRGQCYNNIIRMHVLPSNMPTFPNPHCPSTKHIQTTTPYHHICPLLLTSTTMWFHFYSCRICIIKNLNNKKNKTCSFGRHITPPPLASIHPPSQIKKEFVLYGVLHVNPFSFPPTCNIQR